MADPPTSPVGIERVAGDGRIHDTLDLEGHGCTGSQDASSLLGKLRLGRRIVLLACVTRGVVQGVKERRVHHAAWERTNSHCMTEPSGRAARAPLKHGPTIHQHPHDGLRLVFAPAAAALLQVFGAGTCSGGDRDCRYMTGPSGHEGEHTRKLRSTQHAEPSHSLKRSTPWLLSLL